MSMLAPITHILPFTVIRRERILPGTGKVLVRAGQKVSSSDVIAEANLRPEYLLLNVARGLGVTPEKADQLIQCQAGDHLANGDMIAGPLGMARRVVRTPSDGQVVLVGSGQVLVEVASKPFQLKAGVPGEVVELIADRGATVETTGALVQGVWGNGRIDFGVMVVLAKSPDQLLTPDQLDVSMRGSIALAARCEDPEVFKSVEELPLRGLILASMSASLASIAAKMQIPVVVLEGFGQRPMNSVAFKLLTTNERREVALNAEPWEPYEGTRPEIIIPMPGSEKLSLPQETGIFSPDQQVRVLRPPHVGEIGVVMGIKGRAVFPGGLKAQAADIRLESGQVVVIPLANLDVLA
jgi:hypothetical protein